MDIDNNKKESEKFKKIEDFKSNYKFEWLRDNRIMGDEIPDEIIERRNRWIDDLKKDRRLWLKSLKIHFLDTKYELGLNKCLNKQL